MARSLPNTVADDNPYHESHPPRSHPPRKGSNTKIESNRVSVGQKVSVAETKEERLNEGKKRKNKIENRHHTILSMEYRVQSTNPIPHTTPPFHTTKAIHHDKAATQRKQIRISMLNQSKKEKTFSIRDERKKRQNG